MESTVMESEEILMRNQFDASPLQTRSLPFATKREYDEMIRYCKFGIIIALQALFSSYDCSMILNKINVTDKYRDRVTPLITASRNGHSDIVTMLLDHGADIDTPDEDGNSPLIYACRHACLSIVTLLLDNGANINRHNKYGLTALMRASVIGRIEMVKLLVEYGADVNNRVIDGKTALYYASLHNHLDVIKSLVEYGADVHIKNRQGDTPYDVTDYTDIKQYLRDEMNRHNAYILK